MVNCWRLSDGWLKFILGRGQEWSTLLDGDCWYCTPPRAPVFLRLGVGLDETLRSQVDLIVNSMALTFVLEVDEMDGETQEGQRWQLKTGSLGSLGYVYVHYGTLCKWNWQCCAKRRSRMFARLFTERVKVQNIHVCMGLLTIAHCRRAGQVLHKKHPRFFIASPPLWRSTSWTISRLVEVRCIKLPCSCCWQGEGMDGRSKKNP